MFTQLNTFDWSHLSAEEKTWLQTEFKFKRSTGSYIVGNVVQTDGFTNKDLSVINTESLQAFTNLTTDSFPDLFTATLIQLHKRYGTPTQTEEINEASTTGTTETIGTAGSDAGESKKPIMASATPNGGNSLGDTNARADARDGATPSVQQSNDGADRSGHETGNNARRKKS